MTAQLPKIILRVVSLILFFGSVSYSSNLLAQQICDPNNPNNGLCQNAGFPACYACALVNQVPQCVPDQGFCDDGNPCTDDECVQVSAPTFPPVNGCSNTPLALGGDLTLPIECYVCEPTENNVVVDNGVCDRAVGEDCASDPDECLVPGETCIYPNSPTPVPSCDNAQPGAPIPWGSCEDGDRCTQNLCNVDVTGLFFCTNPDLNCAPAPDGCCPQGCVGPIAPATCFGATVIPGCDPDCWPPQDCGDGLVEAPETCDDAANAGSSGVAPDGSAVPDSACRDAGTQNECTYCGDGILDDPSEECDGTDLGACTTCTGNCTCGIIPPTGICIFGSGFGEGENAPVCGECSLNKHGIYVPGTWTSMGLMALAALLATLTLRRRAKG